MYTAEERNEFRERFVELARSHDIFEGVVQVGGIGGKTRGDGGLYSHVPVSACLYRREDLAEGERLLRGLVASYPAAYIQASWESPDHRKLDAFLQGGLNVTLHLEVTSTLRIKSGNYSILLDKTGKLKEAAPVGEALENRRYAREEGREETENSPYYALFFGLRKCEQALVTGDLFSAELRLSEARLELMKQRMRLEGGNLRASFPAYGKLDPGFLEKLKECYPAAVTEEEILRSAKALLRLHEETAAQGGAPDDPDLRCLFFGVKLGTKE